MLNTVEKTFGAERQPALLETETECLRGIPEVAWIALSPPLSNEQRRKSHTTCDVTSSFNFKDTATLVLENRCTSVVGVSVRPEHFHPELRATHF